VEPLISIRLHHPKPIFQPGNILRCEYQVDAVELQQLTAVEASVLWRTEGKGDEDMGVHFFERRTPHEAPGNDLRQAFFFETSLPPSPLSYEGMIVRICWCARVRVFLRRGREVFFDKTFRLGAVRAAKFAASPASVLTS